MENSTKISANYLGKKLFKTFVSKSIKEGKTIQQIKKDWNVDILNKMSKEFCTKYNFKIID